MMHGVKDRREHFVRELKRIAREYKGKVYPNENDSLIWEIIAIVCELLLSGNLAVMHPVCTDVKGRYWGVPKHPDYKKNNKYLRKTLSDLSEDAHLDMIDPELWVLEYILQLVSTALGSPNDRSTLSAVDSVTLVPLIIFFHERVLSEGKVVLATVESSKKQAAA